MTLAIPQLPTQVQQQGITIKKKTPDILLVINFYSPDGRYDDIYLSNFAYINVQDELLQAWEGVSDINFLGQRDYSIRAWLDPQKLAGAQHLRRRRGGGDPGVKTSSARRPARSANPPSEATVRHFSCRSDTLGRLS